MPYSVSPRRKLMIVGLKRSWNFSTRMPTRLAARKCPSSWTNTRTPSTNANDKTVIKPLTSDLQFYPASYLESMLAGPHVHGAHFGECRHRRRPVSVHRALDDMRDRCETKAAFQKPGDRHLVSRDQHDRRASRRLGP